MRLATLRSVPLVQLRPRVINSNKLLSQCHGRFNHSSYLVDRLTQSKAIDVRFLSTSSKAILKPWQVDVVESNGDYRNETFLEHYIGGPLYENQATLPRLPVPTIDETLNRFLPTALPLARTPEERTALLAACEAFPKQAKKMQERLINRRENEMKDSSWLQLWWNQVGAFMVRI